MVHDRLDGEVVGFEGLSRFGSEGSPVPRFRHAARVGLGTELELLAVRAIVDASCDLPAGVPVSVNLSPATVLSPDLASAIAGASRPLKLEVTEHEPVDDYRALAEAIAALGGVRLSIDDAGSGYASLQHVLRLRPQEVKLDRLWVTGIDRDPARQAMVRSMRSFVAEIGADLVAEGIERGEERDALRSLGVELGQGFLFGRPVPAASVAGT